MTDWKRTIGKALDRLAYRRSKYESWADFAIMGAAELAAPLHLDGEIREDAQKIRDKYDSDELDAMAEMMGCTVGALDENPRQDFLGSMYMALEIGSKHHGQFFTPYAVCEAMAHAQITEDVCKSAMDAHGYISLSDMACGGGATLIAGMNRLREIGIDYQNAAWFVGQDLSQETAAMCYIQLALLGCAGKVIVGNTLSMDVRAEIELPMNVMSPWWTVRKLKGEMP